VACVALRQSVVRAPVEKNSKNRVDWPTDPISGTSRNGIPKFDTLHWSQFVPMPHFRLQFYFIFLAWGTRKKR
jgi:hypothetical protein